MSDTSVLERLTFDEPGKMVFQPTDDQVLDTDITAAVADAIADIKRLTTERNVWERCSLEEGLRAERLEEEAETSDMVLIDLQRKLFAYTDADAEPVAEGVEEAAIALMQAAGGPGLPHRVRARIAIEAYLRVVRTTGETE